MKFRELIDYLDEQFPKELSVSWDNDGVDVCVDDNLEIARTLIVLDVTFGAINYAITHGYNCILSHHPMIFKPLKKLDLSTAAAKKAVMLARHNICAASFHTRLDAVDGGVNDCLLNVLDIYGDIELMYIPQEDYIPVGRVVTLDEEITLQDFVGNIKKSLKKFYKKELSFNDEFNIKCVSGGGKVKKIGVVSGGGMDFADIAAEMGADTFLTGEGDYHALLEAHELLNINLIAAGHFETEAVVLPFVKRTILEKFPDAKVDCYV